MATLRNKTTEAGVIVRWKPHPDHNRPSTYQVTDRAVTFLEEIGFRVPSAGDETEISWGICRPLRVLGDLHFKSETPGKVETGDLADVDENFGHSLTDVQQERLRSYIERHPNYGSTSQSLEGELSSLPEKTSSKQGVNETTNNPKNTTDQVTSSLLETDDIVTGRVDRISSSGNAMLKTDSRNEYNLGSLSESIVGEVVPAAVGNGTWAFCLASKFWNRDYLEEFASKTGYEHASVAKLYLTGGGKDQMDSPLNEHGIEIGDVVTVDIIYSGAEITLGKHQDTIVEVDSDIPLPADEVTAKVIDDPNPILTTELTVSGGDSPGIGDIIDVTAARVDDQNAYCLHDETVVTIPGGNIPTGASLQVAVTAVEDHSVTASIAALPSADRPQQGDAVWVENGTLVEYSATPVEVPPELKDVSDRLRLEVTNVAEDHVAVTGQSWRLLPDASAGDEVNAEIIGWHDDGTLATVEGVPIFLDGFHGNYGGHRRIEVTGLAKEYIHGEIVEPLHQVAEGAIEDFLEAMQEGHRKLEDDDLVSAGDSFSTGMGISPDNYPIYWVDARTCFAYSTIWALARNSRFGGAHDAVTETKEDLQSMQNDAPEAIDICLRELEIIEHAVYAVEAWSQQNQMNVASRKARATAKREIRVAAEKSEELAKIINETELNRRTLHPLVILAADDTAARLDVVHDSVSQFLDKYVSASKPIGWTSLTKIERESTSDQYTLVEPFDPSREPSEELSTCWSRAKEDAVSAENAIIFRNTKREYRRSKAIRQYVRCRADGACEACGEDAPFEDTHGRPYLEFHHVDEFKMSGPDLPRRVVALCPTCHAQIHTGADGVLLNEELRAKLDDGLGTLGS